MARKTIVVSDFSGKEISDPKQRATFAISYGDRRRGAVVADAHVDDAIVADVLKVGRQLRRGGRRPKSGS